MSKTKGQNHRKVIKNIKTRKKQKNDRKLKTKKPNAIPS